MFIINSSISINIQEDNLMLDLFSGIMIDP